MLAAAEDVDGVIAPGIDWPVAIAARIAARFGLPHPLSPETAVLAVPSSASASLAEHGVPQPAWRMATDAELTVPCVVKPPTARVRRG